MKVIVTGATGMVGEGVVHECALHPAIEEILVLTRRPAGYTHPKVRELVHADLFHLQPVETQLKGYQACFFCLGVSSVGMKEKHYTRVTYDLTLHVAGILSAQNTDMTFCYVSGAGTDSSEKGRSMWARVKGRTENALCRLPFRQVYLFRPGYMQPTRGLKNALGFYRYLSWMYPFLRRVFPSSASTLKELGLAMINSALLGYPRQILGVKDIVALAAEQPDPHKK
jgi:uncharacterized protein YbjT (DUF2867 family)